MDVHFFRRKLLYYRINYNNSKIIKIIGPILNKDSTPKNLGMKLY